METQSDENQDQRQDKRGTNEHLQRASSVLFIAVFAGTLTFSSMLGFVSAFALWGIFKYQTNIHASLFCLHQSFQFICKIAVVMLRLCSAWSRLLALVV